MFVGIKIPDFKLYHKAIIIKTICYWQQKQIRGTEKSPETSPCAQKSANFDKGVNNIKNEESTVFSTIDTGETGQPHSKGENGP